MHLSTQIHSSDTGHRKQKLKITGKTAFVFFLMVLTKKIKNNSEY